MTFLSGLVAFTFVALALISAWWTTRKARDVLQKSLGRTIGDGEEMSLKSWNVTLLTGPQIFENREGGDQGG
jgi:hypothetical protein